MATAAIHNMSDLGQIRYEILGMARGSIAGLLGRLNPEAAGHHGLVAGKAAQPPFSKMLSTVKKMQTPTEVDHYQIQRAVDIYVTPSGEDLGRVTNAVQKILDEYKNPGQCSREFAWNGPGHERFVQKLCSWISDLLCSTFPDFDGAV